MAGGHFPDGHFPEGHFPSGHFPEVDGEVGTASPLYFETRFNAAIATEYVSNQQVISGLSAPVQSVVANGEQRVNGGAWTAAAVTVDNDDELELKQTSAAAASAQKAATATIDGVVSSFVTVTAAAEVARTNFRRRAIVSYRRRVA